MCESAISQFNCCHRVQLFSSMKIKKRNLIKTLSLFGHNFLKLLISLMTEIGKVSHEMLKQHLEMLDSLKLLKLLT